MEQAEVYLEPSRTSMTKFFSENNKPFLAINYFRKNSIINVRLGSKYASGKTSLFCEMNCICEHLILFLYE